MKYKVLLAMAVLLAVLALSGCSENEEPNEVTAAPTAVEQAAEVVTEDPTEVPTEEPVEVPTEEPVVEPTAEPEPEPTAEPVPTLIAPAGALVAIPVVQSS